MEKYISALLISFYVYGFAGWVWESFICPVITGGKIKNSGFLNGPIVPIYGVGALSVSLLFSVQMCIRDRLSTYTIYDQGNGRYDVH